MCSVLLTKLPSRVRLGTSSRTQITVEIHLHAPPSPCAAATHAHLNHASTEHGPTSSALHASRCDLKINNPASQPNSTRTPDQLPGPLLAGLGSAHASRVRPLMLRKCRARDLFQGPDAGTGPKSIVALIATYALVTG